MPRIGFAPLGPSNGTTTAHRPPGDGRLSSVTAAGVIGLLSAIGWAVIFAAWSAL